MRFIQLISSYWLDYLLFFGFCGLYSSILLFGLDDRVINCVRGGFMSISLSDINRLILLRLISSSNLIDIILHL